MVSEFTLSAVEAQVTRVRSLSSSPPLPPSPHLFSSSPLLSSVHATLSSMKLFSALLCVTLLHVNLFSFAFTIILRESLFFPFSQATSPLTTSSSKANVSSLMTNHSNTEPTPWPLAVLTGVGKGSLPTPLWLAAKAGGGDARTWGTPRRQRSPSVVMTWALGVALVWSQLIYVLKVGTFVVHSETSPK